MQRRTFGLPSAGRAISFRRAIPCCCRRVEVTVRSAEIQNSRYDKGVQVRYSVRGDDEPTVTAMMWSLVQSRP